MHAAVIYFFLRLDGEKKEIGRVQLGARASILPVVKGSRVARGREKNEDGGDDELPRYHHLCQISSSTVIVERQRTDTTIKNVVQTWIIISLSSRFSKTIAFPFVENYHGLSKTILNSLKRRNDTLKCTLFLKKL